MIVLLGGVGPLLLRDIVRNKDGTLKAGYVVNGGWRFEIREGEYLCKSGNEIVTRCEISKCPPAREVAVPANVSGNYNEIIAWAETQ